MFEERLRLLEGAEACFATASGMSAVFTALGALLAAGDRVVAARALFGSCFVILNEILPRWGVETVFVDGPDLEQWREALSEPTTAVFFETPSNPMQELVDIAAVCELAHAAGAKVVVDNVFATPLLQRCRARRRRGRLLRHQAHRRPGPGARRRDPRHQGVHRRARSRSSCGTPARRCRPFNAWVLIKGLETLALRVQPFLGLGAAAGRIPRGAARGQLGQVPVPGVAPAVRAGHAADEGRRHRGHLRARASAGRTARRPRSRCWTRCGSSTSPTTSATPSR